MRLFYYIDKELIKRLAADVEIELNLDIYEYSEKEFYSRNCMYNMRPELENCNKEKRCRFGLGQECGNMCNYEIQKRHIIIEDLNQIYKNKIYYNAFDKIVEDENIEEIVGNITSIQDKYFELNNKVFLMSSDVQNDILEAFDNEIEIVAVGYKMKCKRENMNLYKAICVYIK